MVAVESGIPPQPAPRRACWRARQVASRELSRGFARAAGRRANKPDGDLRFARLTDDIGDEADGDRLAQLDWLDAELDRAAAGDATHPVFQRLSPVIRRLGLEPGPVSLPDRGEPHGPASHPLPDLRRPGRILHVVGGAGRSSRARGLRCVDARARRALRPRLHRPAARRAPPGRRRGRPARPHLPAARRHGQFGCRTRRLLAARRPAPALRGVVAMEVRTGACAARGRPSVAGDASPAPRAGGHRLRGRRAGRARLHRTGANTTSSRPNAAPTSAALATRALPASARRAWTEARS